MTPEGSVTGAKKRPEKLIPLRRRHLRHANAARKDTPPQI